MNEISIVATSKTDTQHHRIQMILLLYRDLYAIGCTIFFFFFSEMKAMIKLFRIGSHQWSDAPLEPLTQPKARSIHILFHRFKVLSQN